MENTVVFSVRSNKSVKKEMTKLAKKNKQPLNLYINKLFQNHINSHNSTKTFERPECKINQQP